MFVDRIIEPVLALPRIVKKAIALGMDGALCVLTVWLAYSLRVGIWVPLSGYGWPAALGSVAIALPIFVAFGLYRAVFRYVGWESFAAIAQAVLVYGIIYASIFTAFAIPGIPRTVGVIQPVLLVIALVAARVAARYVLGGRFRRMVRRDNKKNVLIYGAGSAGRQLASALSDTADTRVRGFLDDDRGLQGSVIGGIRVLNPANIADAVEGLAISEIFLAIPSAAQTRRNDILRHIRAVGVAVRTLPGILDLAHGKVSVSHLRPLEVEDLLGRDAVAPQLDLLERNIVGKCVMVTGAGGSIGGELCRQILGRKPIRLLLVEANEYALYALHKELRGRIVDLELAGVELVPLLASVCDEPRLRAIFEAWRPATVYHAAAYKHVPLVEHNPIEGVRNNVFGTMTCALLARAFAAENFVLISTDKAVRPTNVMGASKRLAEMVLQAIAAERPATCFSMVRFGNVLGSSGSVVPLFREQISAGGPVTVTHREIIRYFMTAPEAAQLVVQAGAMARGGEVFVLDMGEPVRIHELAARMIELSGLKVRGEQNPDGDIEIEFTGLRPGEKLYEELLIGDNPTTTDHPRVMMAIEGFLPLADLFEALKQLRDSVEAQDVRDVLRILGELVPEYVPGAEVADWVTRQESRAGAPTRPDLAKTIPAEGWIQD
jgi:FlaA1/EpsC-like NDP-sugar epimerase